MSGNECPSRKLLTRRRVLASAGVLPAAGVLISQTDPAAAAVAWTGYVSPESGASVKYPATWGLDTDVVTELVYPKQSFAVRSGGQPGGYIEDIPDLSSYPADGVFLWLLHYDDLQDGTDCPAFRPVSTYLQLEQRISEFGGFARYGLDFSGTQRSFILRLWVGRTVSQNAISLLDRCLSLLAMP